MTTFDDDFIQFPNGQIVLKNLNLDWPPPKYLLLDETKYKTGA